MSNDKQIEEMAKAIFQNCNCGIWFDEAEKIADFVINNQGYRKASDVARETFEKIERALALHFGTYTDNDTVMVRDLFRLLNKFAEEEMEGEG